MALSLKDCKVDVLLDLHDETESSKLTIDKEAPHKEIADKIQHVIEKKQKSIKDKEHEKQSRRSLQNITWEHLTHEDTGLKLLDEEEFDFDMVPSPSTTDVAKDDDDDDEDEIFFGPVGHTEKCVAAAVSEQADEEVVAPIQLTAEQMVHVFESAQTIAWQIENEGSSPECVARRAKHKRTASYTVSLPSPGLDLPEVDTLKDFKFASETAPKMSPTELRSKQKALDNIRRRSGQRSRKRTYSGGENKKVNAKRSLLSLKVPAAAKPTAAKSVKPEPSRLSRSASCRVITGTQPKIIPKTVKPPPKPRTQEKTPNTSVRSCDSFNMSAESVSSLSDISTCSEPPRLNAMARPPRRSIKMNNSKLMNPPSILKKAATGATAKSGVQPMKAFAGAQPLKPSVAKPVLKTSASNPHTKPAPPATEPQSINRPVMKLQKPTPLNTGIATSAPNAQAPPKSGLKDGPKPAPESTLKRSLSLRRPALKAPVARMRTRSGGLSSAVDGSAASKEKAPAIKSIIARTGAPSQLGQTQTNSSTKSGPVKATESHGMVPVVTSQTTTVPAQSKPTPAPRYSLRKSVGDVNTSLANMATPKNCEKKAQPKRLLSSTKSAGANSSPVASTAAAEKQTLTTPTSQRKRRSFLPTPSRQSNVSGSEAMKSPTSSQPFNDLTFGGNLPSAFKSKQPRVLNTPNTRESQKRLSVWSPLPKRRAPDGEEAFACTKRVTHDEWNKF